MKHKFLLSGLMFLFSLSLVAETYNGTCGDNLTWTLDTESGILTISGTGAMTNYTYDYSYHGPSTPWYSYSSSIKTVKIGSSATSIGDYAFYGCSSLTSVTIPNSVTSIGEETFSCCSSLTSVTIPNSVTSIGNNAFSYCSSLTSITIPNSVTSIGLGAFQYCSALTSVTIPNSVTSIGNYAFYKCSTLTSVTIPNSVTSIGESAFRNCSSLTSITIPNSVTSIGLGAFQYCSALTSVTIPNSVTSIEYGAFADCSSLTSITIPNSVTSIGAYAFGYCTSLTSITIPNSVTIIGQDAFYGCSSLTSITIPNSVTSIESGAFAYCSSLTSVVWNAKNCQDFTSTSTPFYYYDKNYSYRNYDLRPQITSFIFSDEVEYIPSYLCAEMVNAKITIMNCKTQIGEHALDNCKYTVEGVYNILLPDTFLCYSDDLILGGAKCPLTKTANTKQTWTRNLKSAEGCDSTVTINVTWRKLPDFTITAKHEYDTYNSGSISYHANYSGKYYYTLNGEKGRSLSNLPAGTYRLVFFSEECDDSVEKTVQIYQYGMKVNNQYYLLDTENHTATLTYRGASYSDYSNEYSGNITIPESITFNGQEYKVTGIGASAFSGCSVTSVTMTSKQPVTISNSSGLGSAIVYVPFGTLSDYKKTSYWYNYNLHVINPSHSSSSSSATSVTITLGNSEEAKHIASCGMEGGEEFAGNVIEYIGLEPESEYADVPFFVKTKEGDYDNIKATFKTSALTLTTLVPKAVSSTTSILLAETNMSDAETSCGFEWRRNDQPADMPSNQVLCPVANGLMAGRLKGLKDDVYYKYRAFYKSAAGNMFYGDWQYIFTGDVTVEFDPVLYTYAAQFVSERKVTLNGYALAGSDDFTEQGFEYWAESRRTDAPARRAPQYAIGEKHTVKGTGISMRVTLEDLDEGTVYKYRTYAKVGGKTLYGSEMTFTTQGTYEDPIETDLESVYNADEDSLTPSPRTPQARKYIRNGILYIEHNGITYTAQGQRLD